MPDINLVDTATAAGYEFYPVGGKDNIEWFHRKNGHISGPFKSLDEAVCDAASEIDMNNAYAFWREEDAKKKPE